MRGISWLAEVLIGTQEDPYRMKLFIYGKTPRFRTRIRFCRSHDTVFSVDLSIGRKIVLVSYEDCGILLSPGGRKTSMFKVCTFRHKS